MESKTTPGTWTVGTNTNSNEWMKIFANGKPIGRALELSKVGQRKATDFEEEQANAKLMAASKDLLEALQTLLKEARANSFAVNFNLSDTPAEMAAQEAINKATN